MNENDEELDEELDEDDFDYEMSEIEEWYEDNFGYFTRNSKIIIDVNEEITFFYNTIYIPIITELAPLIRRLMLKQYPIIRGENRPLLVENINWIISSASHDFVMRLYLIVQDQKEGVNIREKYPKFDSWVDFYGRPAELPVADYTFFDKYPEIGKNLTEQQKREIAEEGLEDEISSFLNNEKLKKEYYDILQPIILKYYKDLEELEYEGWIMYAVQIRESYEDYKYRCEHLDTIIEYGFDEEDINLEYSKFMDKFSIKYQEMEDKRKIETEN